MPLKVFLVAFFVDWKTSLDSTALQLTIVRWTSSNRFPVSIHFVRKEVYVSWTTESISLLTFPILLIPAPLLHSPPTKETSPFSLASTPIPPLSLFAVSPPSRKTALHFHPLMHSNTHRALADRHSVHLLFPLVCSSNHCSFLC